MNLIVVYTAYHTEKGGNEGTKTYITLENSIFIGYYKGNDKKNHTYTDSGW